MKFSSAYHVSSPCRQALLPSPPVEDLKVAIPSLHLVAQIGAVVGETADKKAKLMNIYSQLLSNAVFMRTTINKLESMGSDATARLEKDKNQTLLGFLARSRRKHREDLESMCDLQRQLLGVASVPDEQSSLTEESPTVKLFGFDFQKKFADLMADTMFIDLVGTQCLQLKAALTTIANDIEALCQDLHINGGKNWKAELREDATQEALLAAAEAVKLEPRFMKMPEQFLEVPWLLIWLMGVDDSC